MPKRSGVVKDFFSMLSLVAGSKSQFAVRRY